MEKLSIGVLLSWNLAAVETLRAGFEEITPELFLCGMTKLEETLSPNLLGELGIPSELQKLFLDEAAGFLSIIAKLGINPREMRHNIRDLIGRGNYERKSREILAIHRTESTKSIFDRALELSINQKESLVTLNYLFYELLESGNANILSVMNKFGVDINLLKSELLQPKSSTVISETLPPEDALRLLNLPEDEGVPELMLSIKLPDNTTKKITLKQKEIIIGRPGDKPIDIDLSPDRAVSRQHAKLSYTRCCWYLEDLGSNSGTMLNGKKISAISLVPADNQIQMGNTTLSISLETFDTQETIDPSFDPGKDMIVTNEELIDELAPPKSFSENERIKILAEIMDIATHSRTSVELYEGCIHKIFDAIPNVERATILVDQDGELFPVKHIPREQAYYSETYAKQTKDKRKAFSWLRKDAKSKIPESMFELVAAMYAPMVRNGLVTGVLHADSTSLIEGFAKSELDTLSVIASVLALSIKSTTNGHVTPSVFISYSHKDSKFANKLKGDLRRHGISVWIDERLQAADEAWLKQLAIAIREQRYFLFIMTPSSVSSEYCQWELTTAQSLKKTIIPVMVKKTDIPLTITSMQYIDFSKFYNKGLNVLVETIHRKA